MANRFLRNAGLSLAQQKICLERVYGELIVSCTISKGELCCIMHLQPSLESEVYLVKIVYKFTDKFPKVWLIDPPLEKSEGKYPHHKYEWDRAGHPRLCVYYPGYNEWNPNMNIATSFVPWIVTWLNTYEYWLVTGQWFYDESPRQVCKN